MLSNSNIIARFCAVGLLLASTVVYGQGWFADADAVWQENRNVYVKFGQFDDDRFGSNDHPVQLDRAQLLHSLSKLILDDSERPSSRPRSVFTSAQVETLSRHLASGLATATPQQDVLFSLERKPRRAFGLTGASLYVVGRAFYRNQELNLIFGEYDRAGEHGFAAAYDPTRVGIVAFNFDHGRRGNASSAFRKPVAQTHGVAYQSIDGQARQDWVLLDLPLAAQAPTVAAEPQRGPVPTALTGPSHGQLPGSSFESSSGPQTAPVAEPVRVPSLPSPPAASRVGEVTAGGEPARPTRPPSSNEDLTPSSASNIERRLATLKRLKDQGLISEQAYQTKMMEILQEL